jgi:glucose/arabinose dehydrogenase
MTWFKSADLDRILLTAEHGPRGGDEINIIEEGKDYGWPQNSYGTAYAPENLNDKPTFEGQIVRGELPLFSWLPSVAPSQLVQAAGPEFSKWWASGVEPNRAGDLIVSTLKDQSLHRLRIEEGAVRYVERIEVGDRIRSLSQLLDGKLLLGTDSGKALLLSADTEWSSEEGQKIE